MDGDAAEAGTVRTILQELAGLRASGFAPEDAEMPAAADRSVLATDADGNELASLSLAEREGSFWLLSSGSTYIFEIPTFRANPDRPRSTRRRLKGRLTCARPPHTTRSLSARGPAAA